MFVCWKKIYFKNGGGEFKKFNCKPNGKRDVGRLYSMEGLVISSRGRNRSDDLIHDDSDNDVLVMYVINYTDILSLFVEILSLSITPLNILGIN